MRIIEAFKIKIIPLLLLMTGLTPLCHSQSVVIDTSDFFKRVKFEPRHKNDSSKGKFFPGDFIFMPEELLKNDHWDTLNVRTGRNDVIHKNDTTIVVLNNPNENPFVFPYKGKLLSPFGFRGRRIHAGVDIKLNHGDEVLCAFDGVVRMAKKYSGYGNAVVVRHFNGIETLYGHLSKISVHVNELVHAGDLIGLGGRTGRATTDHLHFETRFHGEPFNPMNVINIEKFSLACDTLFISRGTFSKSHNVKRGDTPQANELIVTNDQPKKKDKRRHSKLGNKNNSLNNDTKSAEDNHSKKGKKKFYTIKKGDTLSEIAEKYGTTPTAICKMNGLKKNKLLKLGYKIRVN
jgi:murein DD-endopeptidase MepM/ murein hydrolase activator NlpD